MKSFILALVLLFSFTCIGTAAPRSLFNRPGNRVVVNRYVGVPLYRVKFVWINGYIQWYEGPLTRETYNYWDYEGKQLGYTFYYVRIR
jgi:hypothetical protein